MYLFWGIPFLFMYFDTHTYICTHIHRFYWILIYYIYMLLHMWEIVSMVYWSYFLFLHDVFIVQNYSLYLYMALLLYLISKTTYEVNLESVFLILQVRALNLREINKYAWYYTVSMWQQQGADLSLLILLLVSYWYCNKSEIFYLLKITHNYYFKTPID